jgi:catechol 2,3-dioxygenase-like lactoylglutathione lyase family enzyme
MAQNGVTALRYVGLAVPDFDGERQFMSGAWGLKEANGDSELAWLAAEGSSEPHVFRLRKAPERRLDVIAFAAADEASVDAIAQRLATAGVKLIGDPGPLQGPGGGYGFRFFDLDGRAIEVSANVLERAARQLDRGESIPATLSHVVLHTPDVKKAADFYVQHLGFRVSDWLGEFMCFLRCNSIHHCLAFLPGPPTLNHAAFEMRDVDEMMRGVGRLLREEVVLGWGPGRHVAGNNAFSYFLSPSGNVVEYTAEVERVDDATWQPTVYTPRPDITDQWGTGSIDGRGPQKLGHAAVDPGLWQAPPV